MVNATPLAACLLAAALAGCGGSGNTHVAAGGDDSAGRSGQAGTATVQGDDSGARADDGGTRSDSSGAQIDVQAQFPLREIRQGDERSYEIVDTFSDASTYTYSRKTLLATHNADGSGERQVFDANGRLIESEMRTAGPNGLLSRHFASTNVTCSYNARRNGFSSPASVGQMFENRLTDTCSNGHAAVIDEKGTIIGAETITVNGTSYRALKAIITENGVVMPPAPAEAYAYSITRIEWFEPLLGLRLKEDSLYALAAPPDGIYQTARSATLQTYLNR